MPASAYVPPARRVPPPRATRASALLEDGEAGAPDPEAFWGGDTWSLARPAPDLLPLAPPGTPAPLAPAGHAAWAALGWDRVVSLGHSRRGQVGVDFFLVGGRETVVVKRAAGVEREWLATQLAADAGCQVPRPMTLGPLAPLGTALGAVPGSAGPEGSVALVMPFVRGRNFFELSLAERRALETPQAPAARALAVQLGHAVAFDLFAGNTDRFAGLGPYGANPGNLMVAGEEVVLIDNAIRRDPALCRGDSCAADRWLARVATLLTLADGPGRPAARRMLRETASVVTSRADDADRAWEALGCGWADGFRRGIVAVAHITPARLWAQGARLVPPPEGLHDELALLERSLLLFQRAAPGARAALAGEATAWPRVGGHAA